MTIAAFTPIALHLGTTLANLHDVVPATHERHLTFLAFSNVDGVNSAFLDLAIVNSDASIVAYILKGVEIAALSALIATECAPACKVIPAGWRLQARASQVNDIDAVGFGVMVTP